MRRKVVSLYSLGILTCSVLSAMSSEEVTINEISEKRAYVCIHDGSRVLVGEKNKFARWFKGAFNEQSAKRLLEKDDPQVNGMSKSDLMKYVGCEEKEIGGNTYCIYSGSHAYPDGFPIANYPGKIALPGGGAKSEETIWGAATREFGEEVGHFNFSPKKVMRYKGLGFICVEGVNSTKRARRFEIQGKKFDALYIKVSGNELENIAKTFDKRSMLAAREKISNKNSLSRLPLHSDEFSDVHLESINSARIYFSNQNIDWFEEVIRYTW